MPKRLDFCEPGFESQFSAFLSEKRETETDVNDGAAAILDDVRSRGDRAVCEATAKYDRFDISPDKMTFSPDQIAQAQAQCDPETLQALELAAARIHAFHSKQRPDDFDETDAAGLRLGYRWTAVGAAGLYVPGGTAAYPSSVLMNAIPAKVAGVERLVMVSPTPDGVVNPLVLAAAKISGINEVYRIGGAQAIGALAYGTATIAPVDKIVGPGNAYVAAAKRQVFGTVGIDMIAGPSEILVLADGDSNPAWIAVDLLSQAEHDTAAQAILITNDKGFADAVVAAVDRHLKALPRTETARASWHNNGAIITVPNLEDALSLIDRIAPEHLEIATKDPRSLALQVRNAGAIFMGQFAPEALGDYLAGPNHVLPTARSARFSSGLGVLDFMKRTSMIECDSAGLFEVGPATATLARAEGLDAHALSITIRLNETSPS